MIYFNIPLGGFEDYYKLMGQPSKKGDTLTYLINSSNASVVLDVFRVFGMSSYRHHHDVCEILEKIINQKNVVW